VRICVEWKCRLYGCASFRRPGPPEGGREDEREGGGNENLFTYTLINTSPSLPPSLPPSLLTAVHRNHSSSEGGSSHTNPPMSEPENGTPLKP